MGGNKRYPLSVIQEVLDKHWPLSDSTKSLSRIFTGHGNSFIFIIKRRGVSSVPLLSHMYITFDEYTWHPGAPNDPIITKVLAEEFEDEVLCIYELCASCSRSFMQNNFARDSKFHIIYNNCQIQLGIFAETMAVCGLMIGILLYTLTFKFVFLLFGIMALIAMLISNHMNKRSLSKTISQCPHIINNSTKTLCFPSTSNV